jgi:hypothetical protein
MATVAPSIFDHAPEPAFAWDEPNFLQYCYFLPGELHDRLLELTENANLALAIGSAEWILARFARFDRAADAKQFVDAVWAEMSSEWRCDWFDPPDDDWCGPVRGPILIAITILYDVLAGRGENHVIADRAVWMHNLALHVIEPQAAYVDWHERVIERLESCHSWSVEGGREPALFADEFPRGQSVAPEALDLGRPYDPATASAALERFVERERRNGNPFVLESSERPERSGHRHW